MVFLWTRHVPRVRRNRWAMKENRGRKLLAPPTHTPYLVQDGGQIRVEMDALIFQSSGIRVVWELRSV